MNSVGIAIKASPRGTRAGFAVISDGAGGALTFTVLPKPWADGGSAVSVTRHRPGTSTHVRLFELDTVEIVTEPGVRDRIAQGVLETVGDPEEKDGWRERYLLERVRLVGAHATAEPRSAEGSLEDVVRLMLLAKRQRSAFGATGYQGSPAESLLRIATQQMFLDELGRVIDRARPRYRMRTESLTTPRGRLSAQSLALSLVTGRPAVESTFDELSTDTDVLRIVLAALRVVATDPAPNLLVTTVTPLRSRAIGFARRLESVTILDRERAVLAYRRLMITPLDRPWRLVLDLAAEVLCRKAIVPEGQLASTSHALTISLYMEKWWEQVLADALQICSDSGTVLEQLPVASPWSGGSAGNADLYFALDSQTTLADAKYKLDVKEIDAADAYQLFAYSYTAEAPQIGRPKRAAVFYPKRAATTGELRSVLVRRTAPEFRLHLVALPFPNRDDLTTDIAWRSYLERLASQITAALRSCPSKEQQVVSPVDDTVSGVHARRHRSVEP